MTKLHDIAICGAGIAGTALAACLAKHSASADVFERR